MSGLSSSGGHRPEIDGLRAVAVTSVVAYHVGLPGAASGFVGVDVFFVISGYLITSKVAALRDMPVLAALASFYARRARRLLPALAIVLLAVVILGQLLLLPTGEQQELGKSGLAAAMFAANIFFWRRGEDYFADPSSVQPLLHTWSLAVEEQFYLVWPLLLLALWGRPPRGSGRERIALSGLVMLTGLSFGLWVWLSHASPAAAFFLVLPRMWELGVGGLLALTLDRSRRSARGSAIGAVGLLLIVLPAAFVGAAPASHTLAVTSAVSGAALVIAGGTLAPRAAVNRLLAMRVIALTGSLSYAWYLWHWPLIAFGRVLRLGEHDLVRDGALAVVAYGLAYLSTRYIEMPIRNGHFSWLLRPRATILAGFGCVLSLAGLCVGLWKRAEWEHRRSLAPASLDCLQLGVADRQRDNPCLLARGQKAEIFLLGDSHANHWSPALSAWARASDVNAFERSRSNCPLPLPAFATNGTFEGSFVNFSAECSTLSESVLREVLETAKSGVPTGVVISAHWETYVPAEADETESAGIERALAALLRALEAAGVRVLLIGPTPEFRFDPPACLARRNDDSCLLARQRYDLTAQPVVRMFERVVAGHPMARTWDPAGVYCDTTFCRPTQDGRLTFRDYGHLSRFGAEIASEALTGSLDWLRGERSLLKEARPAE